MRGDVAGCFARFAGAAREAKKGIGLSSGTASRTEFAAGRVKDEIGGWGPQVCGAASW